MRNHDYNFRGVVLAFFLVSGATGLVLEVAWMRVLGVVFGNTVYAASTVLAAYMLGLALGSVVLGRIADHIKRPLLFYGCLEIAIGLYALVFCALSRGACLFYGWVYRTFEPGFTSLNTVRLILSFLLLLGPTFLMGGTLPVLGRFLGLGQRQPGKNVGYLYGANTLGAVAGCFLAGFVLLEGLGVSGSFVAAGLAAIIIGLLAVILSFFAGTRRQPVSSTASSAIEPLEGFRFRLVMVAVALTGFCSLACEVLWTRILIFVLNASVYSFATMLTTFLAGIAVGSFLSARFFVPRLKRGLLWFGVLELLVGLSILASIALLANLERIDFYLFGRFSWAGPRQLILTHFADAFVVLFVPTLLMGMAWPVVTTCCLHGMTSLGRRVGQVYAANTTGCVLGSLTAGFLLIPLVGIHRSLVIIVTLNLAVGVLLLWCCRGRSLTRRAALALPAAIVAVLAFIFIDADIFHKTLNTYHNPSKITFVKEHSTGTVTVHDLPNDDRLIAVDGVSVAGLSFMLRSTQKLQGYIPLCLHRRPQKVAQIGFGSGETVRVGIEFGVEDYTIVEICPAVFEAGRFFEEINHGSWRDPRVRKVIMDGKNFAFLSGETFDIIMNDSIYPGSSGSSALYTLEHFLNCRRRLRPGGLFSCWVPLDLRPSELRMILKSFHLAFEHTSLWVASNCLNKHALILGSLEPLAIDLARIKAVMSRPNVAADLKAIAINDVYDLLDCFVYDEKAIESLVAHEQPNTDDRPLLEFSCAIPIPEEGSLGYVLAMLVTHRVPVEPYVVNFVEPDTDRAILKRRFVATNHIFQAQVAQMTGEPLIRSRQLVQAAKANPNEIHVETCHAELMLEIKDLHSALANRPHNTVLGTRLAEKLLMAAYYLAETGGEADEFFRQAESLCRQLARSRPPPKILIYLAEICFRNQQHQEAENILKQCLELWPDLAKAHDRLAGIYRQKGKFQQAQEHIRQAVQLAPDNAVYRSHQEKMLRGGR